jgi:hypothetical protein
LCFCGVFCSGQPSDPPTYTSCIPGLQVCTTMLLLREVLLIFCLGWPQILISLISISCITGINHLAWLILP